MNSTLVKRVIEGPYLRDLLDQPRALQNALSGLATADPLLPIARRLRTRKYRRIVLTGMGTSLYALYPLHRAFSQNSLASFWIETAELLIGFNGLYQKDTLLIAVSQSGESSEILRLLRRSKDFGHLIGVTNDPSSRLGRQAGTLLLLNAGTERTVSCKSYLTSLVVLHWLRAALCRDDVDRACREIQAVQNAVQRYLVRWRIHVRQWLALTKGIQSVFITGRAESLATAATAGLILKESTRHHAEGMSCAAFRHGPLEMIESSLVLVYAGDPRVRSLNRRLFRDILRLGGRAAWIASDPSSSGPCRLPPTPPALAPLAEILPVQMLSLALAAQDGREAGKFERASKITTIA